MSQETEEQALDHGHDCAMSAIAAQRDELATLPPGRVGASHYWPAPLQEPDVRVGPASGSGMDEAPRSKGAGTRGSPVEAFPTATRKRR